MIYTIYKATNKETGKCYIGFDSNWPNRKHSHIYEAFERNGNTVFYRALRKYGKDSFEWLVLYQSKDKLHTLNIMEPHFIKENNSYFRNFGYNMSLGGEGNFGPRTKEAIKNSALAHTGLKRNKETKRKMSEAAKNRITTNKFREAISKAKAKTYTFVKNGELITINNLTKYCEERNLNVGNLCALANKRLKTSQGYSLPQEISHAL